MLLAGNHSQTKNVCYNHCVLRATLLTLVNGSYTNVSIHILSQQNSLRNEYVPDGAREASAIDNDALYRTEQMQCSIVLAVLPHMRASMTALVANLRTALDDAFAILETSLM